MQQHDFNRRQFLISGMRGMALFAAGGLAACSNRVLSPDAPFSSLARIGPLQSPNSHGVMLPAGYDCRVVARSGKAASANSAYVWHDAPDGGACFATGDGGWIYVSNAELGNGLGGVGALRFNAAGDIMDSYSILQGTTRNCAGGATPWGTWLSCEEFDRGQVYECDPMGRRPAVLRPALGTFEHEAVAVDLQNNCLYLTEDVDDGGFYRFVSASGLPDLDTGRLEIAELKERAGQAIVTWHEIPDALAGSVDTRYQVKASTPFRGGEGLAIQDGRVYFTTKGDARVWCYHTADQRIEVLYDGHTFANPVLDGLDNVTITPAGDVVVAEDGGNMQIVVITPSLELVPLVQVIGQDQSEICGPAFSPGFDRLYFSSQRGSLGLSSGGITYEVFRL